jgi:precorrin-2 methylase
MGCKSCKQGEEKPAISKDDAEKLASKIERYATVFFIVLGLFSIYGIYSFIKNFL